MRASATALPMPVPAPVTRATLCGAAIGPPWIVDQAECGSINGTALDTTEVGRDGHEATRGAGLWPRRLGDAGAAAPGACPVQISGSPDPAGDPVHHRRR